ncbi:MAG: hypothetical protein WEA80_01885 [Gemmatimonadaceae bacterium]
MPPQTPLILVDNVFDTVNQQVLGVLSSSGDAANRSVRNIANYRRERDYWQAATSAADHYVAVDIGAGNTHAIDACWIDRGHNLWGHTVRVDASDASDFSTGDGIQRVVPAAGTVGGDPVTGWCVTEEGALYTLYNAGFSARRYFRLRVVSEAQPILTGVILGARTQLAGYSRKRDEDAGARTERSQESDAGYQSTDRVYDHRTCTLDLKVIGASEYDTKIRSLRTLLFARNQPAVVAIDFGTNPERAWLFQYSGRNWSFGMERVHRAGTIQLRELYPAIR